MLPPAPQKRIEFFGRFRKPQQLTAFLRFPVLLLPSECGRICGVRPPSRNLTDILLLIVKAHLV